jgi:hypothetical protein
MVAQQRSHSLYDCVSEGAISLDAILAFPIDWQGIAIQQQWSVKAQKQPRRDEAIQTRSPLQIKRAPRSRHMQEEAEQASSTSLGLTLNASTTSLHLSSPSLTLSDVVHSSCPPSPTLSYCGYTSHSDEESSVSTPKPDVAFTSLPCESFQSRPIFPRMESYTSFPLKSFCSAFNDNDEDEVFTLS